MEKLLYIEPGISNRKNCIWKEFLLALAVGLGVWLCLGDLFGLSWAPGEMFAGGLGNGISLVWNQIADVLGSSDYVLLTKTAAQSGVPGLFLTLGFFGTAAAAFFLIRSRKLWTLLFFLLPAVLNVIFQISAGIPEMAVLAAALLASAVYMGSGDGFWMKGILVIGLAVLSVLILQIPGVSDLAGRPGAVREIRSTVSGVWHSQWYGTNSLGNGDLARRERTTGTDTALEVTMSSPQSLYLRGFTGDMYTGDSWEPLAESVYYSAGNLMYWLRQDGFHAAGQIGQAASLAGTGEGENEIQITVKSADKQYAYVPYEICDTEIEDTRNWGNEFFTSRKGGRVRFYRITANHNSVKSWTSTAAALFTTAQNDEERQKEIQDYLLDESYYNEFVYNNYTYLSRSDRELLYREFGSGGDQSEGHIDYKKAISDIRSYLSENFIYTENLGAAGEEMGVLEEFLSSKKGYDVHFATAATLLFRYYGIPARYVEGYLITPEDTDGVKAGETIEVSEERVHAWTEIYIDGIGFVPVEVSPPYEGIMEEADMNIGISNDSLIRTFERAAGGGASDDTELISGGDEKQQLSPQFWIAVTIVLCILLMLLAALLGRSAYRRLRSSFRRRRLFLKEDPKTAVSAMYGYMEKLGYSIPAELKELGNRAAYSRESLDEGERVQMLKGYKEAKKEKRNHDRKNRRKEKKI